VKTPLIEFKNVTKCFGKNTVLERANFAIYENEITTIIGKSGTGKSVLLKHIIGLLTPEEGDILINGESIYGMSRKKWETCRTRISYMFQNNALFDSMTVFENIALPLSQTTNLTKTVIEQKVVSRIKQMELVDVAHKYPSELSGGMQKRVALARALITDPTTVLFDEPTTGQDPVRRNLILSMIARYKKQFGFTAVLISHDIPDIFYISDRILILWERKVDFQGTFEELSNFDHPLMHEFKDSIAELSDELTGEHSGNMLRSRYDVTTCTVKEVESL